mgnify:CR=1 FL=1
MAKQDKETYESYAKDMFDNPPAGPMGVHRGARSMRPGSAVCDCRDCGSARRLAVLGSLFW